MQETDFQINLNDLGIKNISLEIKIKDNGVGMSQEGVKNLFVNFGKLKENECRNVQGTGLGLSICK